MNDYFLPFIFVGIVLSGDNNECQQSWLMVL